ncbi:hypothetical protein STIUS_v1c01380 [Spiroplasma sp. TIUS-1]|uniref:HAD-IIB family hydrolase n=1 Tax=Spiroplasma sp. TIUS-1 TaxID=216963 RepID=UPI001398F946|nr:HAD family hydrolase [Spiroplasma sp. TIUS-1]QHX35693.1 hypothetical protein STIUS_v1c01380 [Spiroplasma sp. TIUS-1]
MSKIKLIVIDLDGTCHIKFAGPHPGNFEAIKKAHDEYGVKVVFATGRTYYTHFNEFNKLGNLKDGDYYVASFNGANIRNLATNTEIKKSVISNEMTKWLWNYVDTENRFSVMSYSADNFDVIYSADKALIEVEKVFCHPDAKYLLSTELKEFPNSYKFLFFGFTKEDKKILEDKGFHVQWEPGGVAEINAKDINKGFVVDYFCGMLKINHSEVLAMGDGANDVASLNVAGYSVCPANSGPAAKAAAKTVSKYTDAEGCVAKTIEELIFNK